MSSCPGADFFLVCPRFFAETFLEILQSRWWSDLKITNPKTCFIVQETLQIANHTRIISVFWRIRHVTTNEWESRADIFLICPRLFVQTFLEILTQNSQISKHAFLLGNCHKSSQKSSCNVCFWRFHLWPLFWKMSDSQITNLKMCLILQNTYKIIGNEHIIDRIWWFRHSTINSWEMWKMVRNEHIIRVFGRFRRWTINEWEYHSRFFCLVSDFLQNFFWRSCRAGGGMTRKLQISKCALFFVNLYKNT